MASCQGGFAWAMSCCRLPPPLIRPSGTFSPHRGEGQKVTFCVSNSRCPSPRSRGEGGAKRRVRGCVSQGRALLKPQLTTRRSVPLGRSLSGLKKVTFCASNSLCPSLLRFRLGDHSRVSKQVTFCASNSRCPSPRSRGEGGAKRRVRGCVSQARALLKPHANTPDMASRRCRLATRHSPLATYTAIPHNPRTMLPNNLGSTGLGNTSFTCSASSISRTYEGSLFVTTTVGMLMCFVLM